MAKIKNTKVTVPETIDMNDANFLYDILATEKCMSVNMVTMLNEISNQILFDKIEMLFREIKQSQHDLFELLFKKGWYTLEEAEQTKIDEKTTELQTKLDEFSKA